MSEIVIVGAGIAGLGAALLLGRHGRRVIICERDAAPVPDSTEAMWSSWPRPGTPQAPLGHGFNGSFRKLLLERAPDIMERLLAAGVPLKDFAAGMPGDERLPEDADFVGFLS